ncbi:PIK-related kinase FATC [Penicillium mononematosum]|uniref:PIK-related kinase FATC n=1 Tax=Penicillium mononematosum TaxID=268346 RepID=UPI0025493520|nr:PIK-related kinase FATC [Penicillium mononematosum]KAJ6179555.1 PIK-related kinase FATC [Penicillium mononematosum]
MAQAGAITDVTQRLFVELKSKNEEARARAAYELYDNVLSVSRDWPSEKFVEFYNAVSQRIAQLVVNGSDANERIGGLLALDRLIDFDGVDAAQKTTRFASYLRSALRSNDNVVLVYAARSLGRLAKPGGALTAELVESEIQSALEWLQSERQESRRFAAVLVIRELAKGSPTLLYGFVSQIFQLVWVALRDPKVLIRETAAEAVGECFEIIVARDSQVRQSWFARIHDEALLGLKSHNIDWIHGSILIIKELILKGTMFMKEHYRNACEIILRLKDHRDPKIRTEVVLTIPILASYAPTDFTEIYLHKFMVYLQAQLKRDKERNSAFIAIGKIANAVGTAIGQYLDGIIIYIREGLAMKARNRSGVNEAPMFECISMLSLAVGQALSKYMEALLDPIFACGLSKSLTQALVDMAHYIPPIKPMIQEKLLDMLSIILCGTPFRPLGCPENRLPPMPSFAKDFAPHELHSDSDIALALHTLGSFDFSGHILNEFVRDVAINYVENDNPEIRKASALTCCQLFVHDPIINQTSGHSIQVVSEVIDKLLTVGIGDPDPEIRRTVLWSLDRKFDRHLARPENIRCLFLAVNDEVFDVKEAAICIIGRLSSVNPAYVFPPLRKLLVNLLTGLGFANTARQKEETAQLISLFVSNATKLIRSYVDPMVTALLPKSTDINPGVAATTLKAVGELASVGGHEMRQYLPQIMPIILDSLQDLSSHNKREAALRTLGQLASNSGYVIEPYMEYPHLLAVLINIIKTEQTGSLRKETIKLVGVLGALDPYKYQQISEIEPDVHHINEIQNVSDVALIMQGLTPSNEEYYPTVVIHTLMQNILRENSLAQYHSAVIDAIVTIFKTLGLKCVPFLGQIIPGFILVIRSAPASRLESYFNQMAILVNIVRQHIRTFLPEIIEVIRDFWDASYQIQGTILSLVEAIARSLEGEFRKYLAGLIPLMLDTLDKDTSPRRQPSEKILHALLIFGTSGEEYMHLIIPSIVRLFDRPQNPQSIRKSAIDSLTKLSRQVNVSDFASLMVHSLSRVVAGGDRVLRQAAMDCICALIFQLGQDFTHYIHLLNKVLKTNQIAHTNYQILVTKLQKGDPLPQDLNPEEVYSFPTDDTNFSEIGQKKIVVNQQHLKNAWDASQKSTRDDWQEWIRRFSIELLKESPSPALRACASLAGIYQPLSRDLFNAAFVSCWTELYDQYQEELVRSIEKALTSPNISPEILQILLNLAEFMEHDDKALPIDIRTLGKYAAKCHAFAKALHYKELEFEQDQNSGAVEALITINNQLQQSDAAIGILRKAQAYRDVELKETWFEKLQRWDEALAAYKRREKTDPDSFGITMGKMRCLHALGEWKVLSDLAQEKWNQASLEHRRAIAPLAAAAAWGWGQWELMDSYLGVMKEQSPDRSFFGAILAIHRNQFDEANMYIEKARNGLDTELSALLGESYNRAYNVVVRVQMLAELEEIITYKQNIGDPEKQDAMRKTWNQRLLGCQQNVEVWQRMLKVRALVTAPRENLDMSIKFANLCRKSNRMGLAERSLASLETVVSDANGTRTIAPPEVTYARLKFSWANGHQLESLEMMKEFTSGLTDDFSRYNTLMVSNGEHHGANGVNGVVDQNHPDAISLNERIGDVNKFRKLLSKSYLRQGEWQTALQRGDWRPEHVREVLNAYSAATQYNRDSYKAWHSWALANFEVVTTIANQANREGIPAPVPAHIVTEHVIPAIRGFIRSIALSLTSSLQDTLRLLTLWFNHGGDHEVNTVVTEGFTAVNIDTWLAVTPQLIARINQPNIRVRGAVHRLLAEVGKAHPQALVYPLTVAMKSNVTRRSQSASNIMESMRQHSAKLVEQADLVSHELIRVAVLWHELWHEGLEEASRLYFGDHNVEGMFSTLAPFHDMLDKGAETLREVSFAQAFGRDLAEAKHYCMMYRESEEIGDLNQAWDLYYTVFRKISRQLPQLSTLDLKYVSPRLKDCADLDLAVPGTYQSGKPVIRIMSFDPILHVLQTKKRPRRMTLKGSNGSSYMYLVKGHEDIRQDERVMQLFGLCNTLLDNDGESFKRHLSVQRFPAIPLSQSSGLLGWVSNSDTLHALIKEYRESRRILLNIEHRIMLQMAPDYDSLTLMQKVEVFGYAMDNTTGKDLYRVLWLKSKSSEAWLERRTNYTRSLGVMSMVGYILGLGDRHPSNLLLDRGNGRVVHIDFGDCFEIAMHREKYPERVPFRLTRMLTFAMEVSNIEGSYRITCEAVMRVLREHKDSLMAVLEAFIHDPLINWRLGTQESPDRVSLTADRRQSIMDGVNFEPGAQPPGDYSRRRRPSMLEGGILDAPEGVPQEAREAQNARALQVLARVKEKLTGRDFRNNEELSVSDQVDKLIAQATNVENICQHWIGWCSFCIMGGDLNLKKSWHPGLLKNQERVWLEEKRALEERKQIAQLQREREEERQMEEIQRLQEAAGKTKQHRRVDWMYQAPSTETGHYSEEMEGYLLGKRRIDGVLLKNDPDTKKLEKGSEMVGNGAAAGPSIASARDTMSKVMADPLLEVKKREQAAYEAMVKETLRRKEREKERGDRDRGKDRDRRHRTHDSKRRRYSDDAGDDRRDRHHRRSSPRRHRSRSPASPDRSSRRYRSDRERGRRNDERRSDSRDRRRDEHRSRRDDRDRAETVATTKTRETPIPADTTIAKTEVGGTAHHPDLLAHLAIVKNVLPQTKIAVVTSPGANTIIGVTQAGPWGHPRPDPKEMEEERRRKLAEMQSNATEIESERQRRIAEISAKEEQQREADDRQRSDRGRFMSDVNKRVQEDTLDERIRRSRGGLAKMEED